MDQKGDREDGEAEEHTSPAGAAAAAAGAGAGAGAAAGTGVGSVIDVSHELEYEYDDESNGDANHVGDNTDTSTSFIPTSPWSHLIDHAIWHDRTMLLSDATQTQRNGPTFAMRQRIHMFVGGIDTMHPEVGNIVSRAYDAGVHVLIGCDTNEIRVAEAHTHYTQLTERVRLKGPSQRQNIDPSPSMFAGFSHDDAFTSAAHHHASVLGRYDLMIYFGTLHRAVKSRDDLYRQFVFWKQQLTDTGTVIIETVDTQELCSRLSQLIVNLALEDEDAVDKDDGWTAFKPLVIENTCFRIEWPARKPFAGCPTGVAYQFSLFPTSPDGTPTNISSSSSSSSAAAATAASAASTAYFIRTDDILTLADEFGFECTRDLKIDPHHITTCNQDKLDTLRLFRTFVLSRKTAHNTMMQQGTEPT